MVQPQPQSVAYRQIPKLEQPQRIAEGFLLTDLEQVWSWRKSIYRSLFVVIWNIIAFVYLVSGVRNVATDRGAIITIVISGLLALGGLMMLAKLIIQILLASRFFPGELVVSRFPLRLGEASQVRYRRRLRRGQTQKPAQISAQLVCYEWIRCQQGTDVQAFTQKIWEQALPVQAVPVGISKLEYEGQIQIPRQGTPSFEANDNCICWELQVAVDLPGLLIDASTFRLRVVPEVVA